MSHPRDEVRTLLPFKPLFTPADAKLREVAVLLRDKDVGALLVRDSDGFGILSERDVVSALADGADPDEIWAADVMTRDVLIAEPQAEIVYVGLSMIEANVRHVVLVEDADVVGVVSIRDVAAALVHDALTRSSG
jgi:CBS domain-containing protein